MEDFQALPKEVTKVTINSGIGNHFLAEEGINNTNIAGMIQDNFERISTLRNNNSIILMDQKGKEKFNEGHKKGPKRLSKMDLCRVDLSSLALVHGPNFKIKALSIADNKEKIIYVKNGKTRIRDYSQHDKSSSSISTDFHNKECLAEEINERKEKKFLSHFEKEDSVSEAINNGGNLLSCTEEQFDKFWKEQMELSSSQEDDKPRIIVRSHSQDDDKPKIETNLETEVDAEPKTKVRLVKFSDGRVVRSEKPHGSLTRETLPGRDLSKSASSGNSGNSHSQVYLNEPAAKGNNIVVYNLINGNLVKVKNRCPQSLQAESRTETRLPEESQLNTSPALPSPESNALKRRHLSSKTLLKLAYDKWDPVAKKICRNPVVTLHRLKPEEILGALKKSVPEASLMKKTESTSTSRSKRLLSKKEKSDLVIENKCPPILPEERQLLKSNKSKIIHSTPSENQTPEPLEVKNFKEIKSNSPIKAVMENKIPKEFKEPNFIRYKSIFNSFVTINNIYDRDQLEKLCQMLMDCLQKLKTTKTKSKGATLTIQLGEISAPTSDEAVTDQSCGRAESVVNEPVAFLSESLNQPNSENSKVQFLAKFNLFKILSTKVPLNQIEPTTLNKQTNVSCNTFQECSLQSEELRNQFEKSNLDLNISFVEDDKKQLSRHMKRILVLKNENELLQKLLKEKNQYIDTLVEKLRLVESICSDVTGSSKLNHEGVLTPDAKLFYPEVIMTESSIPHKKMEKQSLLCKFDNSA